MDFPIQINKKRIWNCPMLIHLRGHSLKLPNNYVLQSLEIVFIIANSSTPGEMLRGFFCILSGSSLFAKVPLYGLSFSDFVIYVED